MRSILRLLALAAAPAVVSAVFGIDVGPGFAMSNATAACLVRQAGAGFAIVAGTLADGTYDPNVATTTDALWNAQIPHVDVSFNLCGSKEPTGFVNQLVISLDGAGVNYGMLWPIVRSTTATGCGWTDVATNCAYIQSVVAALQLNGVNWGVFTTASDWNAVVGSACSLDLGSQSGPLQLWYQHIDGSPSFSDFKAFGNFTSPAIKQYALNDNTNACGYPGAVNDDFY